MPAGQCAGPTRVIGREDALLFQVMGVSASALIHRRANDNNTLGNSAVLDRQIAISGMAGSRRRRSPGSEVTTCCPVRRAQITTWASTMSMSRSLPAACRHSSHPHGQDP